MLRSFPTLAKAQESKNSITEGRFHTLVLLCDSCRLFLE